MGRRRAHPIPGTRRRLLYSTGTAAGVIGLGVALMASPALAKMATQHGPFARPHDARAELSGDSGQSTDDEGSGLSGAGQVPATTGPGATGSPSSPTPSSDPTPTATQTVTVPGTATGTVPATTPTATTTQAAPTTSSAACTDDAPATLTDDVAEHTDTMTRISCDTDVAVYYDEPLRQASGTDWITPFATEVWQYVKTSYGTCAADRSLGTQTCENFGAPEPALFFMHQGTHSGGTVATRFQESSGHRTTIDVGYGTWSEHDTQLRDIIVHEACHQVELAGQGTSGSPALALWGDSKWAEFCVHDFYANTAHPDDADRTEQAFLSSRDDLPAGAHDAAWFRDWFLPLWKDGGGGPDVMRRYFELTARYFPTAGTDGQAPAYTRDMTMGEYVLFTSAAAGEDLSARAAEAFGDGFSPSEFARARQDFPQLTF
ncbi:hypothetical protein KIH74_10970 [Kineosporia sp. J2-2]|uniref:Uncharacterized protein n=1 Tax=Kineosporia corallincola TaxID=2835133 RepID=A0ABS5TED8_9ACTN|nr:hypothetical protein [Kineosporia corallincola]MBT0769444.1 hypothetical protein [Kineosporia corallincola]